MRKLFVPLGARLLGAVVFLSLVPLPARPDPFPVVPAGARVMAMGGAAPALWNSPSAAYYNPAGLAWQVVSGGMGLQPTGWSRAPDAWWVHLYNRGTEYGFPLALALQGWRTPSAGGDRRTVLLGMPSVLSPSLVAPVAVHIKGAFERDPDGRWRGAVPIDLAFLGRSRNGPVLGLVFRNMMFGRNSFATLQQRAEYGVAWSGGRWTFTLSSRAKRSQDVKKARDHFSAGIELIPAGGVALRGGYLKEERRRWVTAGIGLRSPRGAMEVAYAVVIERETRRASHFLHYIFRTD